MAHFLCGGWAAIKTAGEASTAATASANPSPTILAIKFPPRACAAPPSFLTSPGRGDWEEKGRERERKERQAGLSQFEPSQHSGGQFSFVNLFNRATNCIGATATITGCHRQPFIQSLFFTFLPPFYSLGGSIPFSSFGQKVRSAFRKQSGRIETTQHTRILPGARCELPLAGFFYGSEQQRRRELKVILVTGSHQKSREFLCSSSLSFSLSFALLPFIRGGGARERGRARESVS
jgi:hypothetical protein